MSMPKFTPGPWRAALYLGGAYYVTDAPVHEPCGREVAIVSGTWGNPGGFVTAGDNARLIAAAPTLYEALEFALRDMEMARALYAMDNPSSGVLAQSIALARAALAKAERQP